MEIGSPVLLDLLIFAMAIVGVALLALHLLHHAWTASGGFPFGSLALLLSSTTLALARKRLPWWRAGYWRREDRRLLATAAIVLALACVLVALFTIGTLADAHRKSLIDALQADRDAVRGAIAGSIRIRTAEVLELANNEQLRQLLQERVQSPTADPDISDFVAALHAIKPLHYAVLDASGQLLMDNQPRKPLAMIELPVRVEGDATVRLARARRESGLILRVLAPIRQADRVLGELAVDLPLPAASASFVGLLVHHPLTTLRLCARSADSHGVSCLDGLSSQEVFFGFDGNSDAPELRSTVGEHASVVLRRNGIGHAVSYGPIGDTGLGVVVSTPAKELLAPVLDAVRTAMLLAPGVIVLGVLLLAWQMRPLARSLHQQRNMLQTAFEFSGIGIQILDTQGRMIDCNPAFAAMLGYSKDELLANSYDYALIHESERELAQSNIRDIAQSEIGPYCAERRYRHKNGGYRTLRWHVSPVRNAQGQAEYVACFCIDATDTIAKADALRFQTAFFHAVLDELHDVVYAANADGVLIYANRAAARAGIPAQMALTLPELAKISPVFDAERRPVPADQLPLETALRGETMHRREFTIRNLAGQWRECQISAYPLRTPSGQALGAVGVAHDVTDLRTHERHLRWLLEHDELTRLPNRYAAQRLISARLAAQEPLAMALLDIDRFKHINDSYGHAFGDQLLHAVAERLSSHLAAESALFRLGSDEFLAVARCAPDQASSALGDRVLQAFDKPFEIGGQTLFVSATVGMVCAPDDGDTTDTLFARADMAMYRAKQHMPGSALRWRDELGLRSREQVEMESELRSALARGQFEVFYQPKVCLRSGRIVGAEALLRWRHPQRGLVSPAAFIPLLEETGLIVPVGAWTLQTVCDQQSLWRDAGVPVVPIAVNCSVRQLQGDLLLRQVESALGASRCQPALLELEITESMMLHDPDRVSALVSALRTRGVLTSIDDFGTGYSSLASLKKLPVSALKLDRAFVKDLPDDADDAAITRAVLSMAKALSIDVIAEGVETLEQVAFLAELGCAAYQGYLFSPPVPADEFSRMLRRQSP